MTIKWPILEHGISESQQEQGTIVNKHKGSDQLQVDVYPSIFSRQRRNFGSTWKLQNYKSPNLYPWMRDRLKVDIFQPLFGHEGSYVFSKIHHKTTISLLLNSHSTFLRVKWGVEIETYIKKFVYQLYRTRRLNSQPKRCFPGTASVIANNRISFLSGTGCIGPVAPF